MKNKLLITLITLCLSIFVFVGCKGKTKTEQSERKEVYQCPMDCENGKTYDKPGKCPVCEMELEVVKK